MQEIREALLKQVRVIATLLIIPMIAAPANLNSELVEAIEQRIWLTGGSVSVAFHDLKTGEELLIRADERFHPASTIKVPIMMEVFDQVRQGRFKLDDRIPIRNEFKSIADGSPFSVDAADDAEPELHKRIGQTATIRELCEKMIRRSSNLATNLLVDKVTPAACMELMRRLRAPGIEVLRGVEDGKAFDRGMNNVATARGLMRLLTLIASRKAVSGKASDQMVGIMLGQTFREGIPAGVPAGVLVANKTGWTGAVDHDAAIVYPADRLPYVLVIMTLGIDDTAKSRALMSDISRLVYDRLNAVSSD